MSTQRRSSCQHCQPHSLFLHPVEGASDAGCPMLENVGVDHGGGDVAMAEQFLDGSDVVAVLEKMGGE